MFYKPKSAFLNEFIQCFWFIKHDSIPIQTKILPDGHSDIMLNFGKSYSMAFNNESEFIVNDNVFVGQRTKTLLLNQTGNVNMVGVRLHPGKEYAFLNQSAHLFQNTLTPLHLLMGKALDSYLNDFPNCHLEEHQVAMTEQLFENHFKNSKATPNSLLDLALKNIQRNIKIEHEMDFYKSLNLNYKQSERMFKKHIGITPKKYLRVIRFYQAYMEMRSKKTINWLDVLNEFNFYDQSHFIKEYYYFTGNSPKKQFRKKDTLEDIFGF